MDNDQRSLFIERLRNNILEVHYISEDDEYHEIECTLKENVEWFYNPSADLNDITVWNSIDSHSRSFSFDLVKTYILREWDENGDLTVHDYDFDILINNTR